MRLSPGRTDSRRWRNDCEERGGRAAATMPGEVEIPMTQMRRLGVPEVRSSRLKYRMLSEVCGAVGGAFALERV